MKNSMILLGFIITTTFVDAQDLGNPSCDSLLLVSSWSKDNVKIYDGCDGNYIKDLADPGVLDGPQAMFQDNQGNLIVVSESNHKLIKFDQDTLSNPTTVVPSTVMENPITVIKKNANNIYLGSYASNEIIEMNTDNWQKTGTLLSANNNKIRGIDIGMAMGPDGHLYVPGYDSDSILKVNPNNGNTQQFIPSGAHDLDRPRSVLFLSDRLLVTAWGNQAIYSFAFNGQLLGTPVTGLPGVAGMIHDGPDHILVTSDTLSTVRRYNINDFTFETIIPNRSGGLTAATFVYRLTKTTQTTSVTDIKQAWLTGIGEIQDNQILVNPLSITTGGAFGDQFNPAEIESQAWGALHLEFSDCHNASMTYTSNLQYDGIPFGSGGYSITRIALNAASDDCQQMGMASTSNRQWLSGTFYGGPSRNGEGFTLDYLNENQVIVTWFTYLPQ